MGTSSGCCRSAATLSMSPASTRGSAPTPRAPLVGRSWQCLGARSAVSFRLPKLSLRPDKISPPLLSILTLIILLLSCLRTDYLVITVMYIGSNNSSSMFRIFVYFFFLKLIARNMRMIIPQYFLLPKVGVLTFSFSFEQLGIIIRMPSCQDHANPISACRI